MEEVYRDYSIMPGPNDPGVLIRTGDFPNWQVVGSAATNFDARAWIDIQIDGPPQQKKESK